MAEIFILNLEFAYLTVYVGKPPGVSIVRQVLSDIAVEPSRGLCIESMLIIRRGALLLKAELRERQILATLPGDDLGEPSRGL